jgi:DNA/RNA endonuclease YhcR with UshA esterase domain
MEKNTKILLILSLLGIMILLIIIINLEPKILPIGKINENYTEKEIKVIGNIIKVLNYNNNTFHVLTINDSSGKIKVIFNSRQKEITINSSLKYEVLGKVEEYNKTLQIKADRIIRLN